RIADIDGVSSVQLFYRVDGSGAFTPTAMNETGDLGIYAGQIPGQTNGTLMAFYIAATDGKGASSSYPANPEYRQCLYQVVGSPRLSNFPVYRILIPSATGNELDSRPKMSNHLLPCSFIYDDTEMYYNCLIRLRGSPFIRGAVNPVHSKRGLRIRFPSDNPLHGRREMNLDIQNPRGGMSSLQNERVAYWIARKIGIPWSQIRFVRVLCNQTDHGLYGDVQKVDQDYLSFWFPDDDDGYLYKIDDWFEFTDSGSFSNRDADLRYWERGNTQWWGEEKELYRWNYRPRNRDSEDNLEPIINLISKMDRQMSSSNSQYVAGVESVLDVEEALKEIAVRHVVGDWDSWGYNRGKNNLLYRRPSDGRFVLIPWDIDFVLGSGDGPSTSLTATSLYGFNEFFTAFGEEYERVLWEIADGPLAPGAADGYMDRTFLLLSLEGLGVQSPSGIKSYLASRRSFIVQKLDRPVAITTNGGEPLITSDPTLPLTGTAPYNAETMTLNGEPVEPEWVSSTSWALHGVLSEGVNDLTVELFDGGGVSLGTTQITITLNPFTIHTLVVGPSAVFIAWNSTPGQSYSLLAGDTPSALSVVATDLKAQGPDLFYFDYEAPLFRRRFYRVNLGGPTLLPGLKAEYFSGMNFNELVLTRVDDVVEFDWGEDPPAAEVPADGFSVRWTGFVIVDNAGLYTFRTDSDDGVRLTVSGERIIENWTDHSSTSDWGDISLAEGIHSLVLEFYENTSSALMRLDYQGPGIPLQTIPTSALGH
ncbi:CotH kinase family protein, partial [bacterium]|nr:CotH kinase family protein [bacterium]